jgi:glycosyltransferase involved in cell wall biosynthesis
MERRRFRPVGAVLAHDDHAAMSSAPPLRIAQVAPLYESTPPSMYGGTERVVAFLTDALVELGHHVTLFSSADARTRATLIPVRDLAIRLDPATLKSDLAAHLSMLYEVRARIAEFDLVHFHVEPLQFPFFEHCPERTVTTMHGRLDLKDVPAVYARWPDFPLVSISDAQRRPLPLANWVGTVHHGLPPDLLPYAAGGDGYLAFLGRISPEKRPDRAIEIARASRMPLRMAAKVDAADRVYYQREIEPLIASSGAEFVGEIGDADKRDFLGRAAALLFPIDWPEPFGLVMIEAMACGTPVIAWDCGSVREIVQHGETGFIVRSADEAVTAVRNLAAIDRRRVRAEFERRFSAEAMARRYTSIYRQLLTARAGSGAGLEDDLPLSHRSANRPLHMT